MKYISVCSGIEAATVAWHHLGWEPAWFSEIEPFPCSVLKHHYPDVPNLGDMTKWSEWPNETVDLLVGGTPCQSFSVAGKRGGMDDHRGQLALSFSAIAAKYKPRWIVWENVPGVLSSGGGRDFGAFLGSLAELGYGCAYRVLDAQHFGVAQRRRRVFVVGYLGDWRRAAAVLFERKSLQRDFAKGGKARKGIAGTISRRTTAGGGLGTDFELAGGLQVAARQWPAKTASTLYASFGSKLGLENQHINEGAPLFVLSSGQGGAEVACDRSPTITCNHEAPIMVGVQTSVPPWVQCPEECGDFWCNIHQQHTGDCECPPIDEWVTDPYGMQLEGPAANQPIVLMDQGGSVMNTLTDGTTPTLKLGGHGGGNPPAIVLPGSGKEDRNEDSGVCPTLKARMGTGGGNVPAIAIGTDCYNGSITGDVAATMGTPGSSVNASGPTVMQALQVRRLTPVECERLQGFPDGYTNVPHRGKPAADGPRYKALGNSMAVPVMRWIGERIEMVESIRESEGGALWNP